MFYEANSKTVNYSIKVLATPDGYKLRRPLTFSQLNTQTY